MTSFTTTTTIAEKMERTETITETATQLPIKPTTDSTTPQEISPKTVEEKTKLPPCQVTDSNSIDSSTSQKIPGIDCMEESKRWVNNNESIS